MEDKLIIKPVVKWAGGKRQIINKLLEYMPKQFNNYYEPFIGGGALFFEIAPVNAIINDVNTELLAIYECLKDKDFCTLMLKELDKHEINHSEEYYYKIRSYDRNPRYDLELLYKRAARAIYLNKACFNGLYRVNSRGYFNVPSAKKEKVITYDKENINKLHNYFLSNNITILSGDFVNAVKNAKKDDFVYFDPPYDPYEEKRNFTSYTKYDFNKEDQLRLANLFKELSSRGVKCMLSNHNTQYIRELYDGFNINIIYAKRMINSNANDRGSVEEVIITNY